MTAVAVAVALATALATAVALAVWVVNDRRTATRLDRLAFAGVIRRLDDVPIVTGHVINADLTARDQIEDAHHPSTEGTP